MYFQPRDYQAIIFDLGGVLLNLDYKLTEQAFKELGISENYSQREQTSVFDAFEIGEISPSTFRNRLKEQLTKTVADSEIDAAWNKMLLDLPPNRIALLKKIKDTCPIFLFSNTNAIHFEAFRKIIQSKFGKPDLLETVFTQTYYSHLVNARKPNTEAFQIVLDEHKLDPSEVLFIDDSIQHIKGAETLGIRAYHLEDKDITDIFTFD